MAEVPSLLRVRVLAACRPDEVLTLRSELRRQLLNDVALELAPTPAEVVQRLTSADYDVALFSCDSQVAHDLLRDLRARGIDTPAVLLVDGPSEEEEAHAAGFNDWLPRAAGVHDLGLTLRRAVRLARGERDRTRLARELDVARVRLEHVVRSAPQILHANTLDGRFTCTFMAPNVLDQLGWEPQRFVEDRSFRRSLAHPEDAARVRQELAGMVERGSQVVECRFRAADGSWRWMRDELRVMHDTEGRPLEVVGCWTDITQQRAAEAAERERIANERLLLDSTAEGIYSVNVEGVCTFVNAAAQRMLGRTREELLGQRMHDLIHHHRADGSEYPVEECRILRACRGGAGCHVSDEVLWRADGTSFSAEYRSFPMLSDGRPVGAVVTFNDITEQIRAEAERQRAELRLRYLNESGLLGVLVSTPDGDVLEANDEFLRILGRTRAELEGGKVNWTQMTPPEWMPTSLAAVQEVDSKGLARPREKEYLRDDGSRVPVLFGVARLDEASGTAVSFALDLSERRSLEAQLRQAQKMEAIGSLAGGVAHDFNNLLTVIVMAATSISQRLSSNHPLLDDVTAIQQAAGSAAALTRQLLAFSSKQPHAPRPLQLNELLRTLGRMLRRLIAENVDLALDLDPELGLIHADMVQLEQVVVNLVVNARDAMPHGGRITVATSNVEIMEGVSDRAPDLAEGPYVMLTVRDTGVGMDAETRSRAFEPFFTTKPRGQGTGLGLSTVYGIVKQHRGSTSVDSEPGKGTAFRIVLPRLADAP